MKKILSFCLLLATSIAGISFTKTAEKVDMAERNKRICVKVDQSRSIGDNACVALFQMSFVFNWAAPNGEVTELLIETPAVTVRCGRRSSSAQHPAIAQLGFNKNGHVINLGFSKTEDTDVDELLSNPNFLDQLILDMNAQIDAQKS